MKFDQVELRVVRVPYKAPFKTSFGAEAEKVAAIITVRSDGVEGYGESVMEPLPLYREETLAGGLGLLRDALVPDLLRNGCEQPSELTDRWARWRGNNMAKASLELAVWDCHARQQGVPLKDLLSPQGAATTEIPVGASLGMNTLENTVASVERHVAEGYRRVKLKIEPGWDRPMLSAVRAACP
jgi:O-succinylbenzoate synthase